MKQNTTHNLEEIKMQSIDMHNHRTELRRALLTSSHWDKQQKDIFSLWKGGEKIMQKNKFITTGVALGILAVVFISGLVFIPKNDKTAYAEQIAQQSYHTVSTLTPEQQEEIKQRVHMDPTELLKDAKNAKDLQSLTYDQFISQYPEMHIGPMPGDAHTVQISDGDANVDPAIPTPGNESMDMHALKFLQFTDKDGNKVVIGIDQKNLPVFAFSSGKDGSSFSVQGTGKSDGPMSGAVRIKDGKGGIPEKGNGSMQMNDNSNEVIIDGKKYTVPGGTTKGQSTVKMDGNEVYINDVKAVPAK
jgi:hypothetical protein